MSASPARALRDNIARRIGEGPFRGLFSLLPILSLGLLIGAWHVMWTPPLWDSPGWLRWVLVALMLVAFVAFVPFVTSVSQRSPTMIGGEAMTCPWSRSSLRLATKRPCTRQHPLATAHASRLWLGLGA